MKKLLIIIFCLLISSCTKQLNPRKVAYPFSIYLFENDEFFKEITKTSKKYGVAILSSTPYKSATVELESGLDVKLFIATSTGDTFADALSHVHIEGCNMINLHYVKSFIIHHNLLNEPIFTKALSFIYFNNVIRPNIYFYTTSKDFKEIYNVSASNGKSPYFNMINSSIFPADFERMKQQSLNDFLSSYLDNRATYIIDLDITKDNEFIKDEEDLIENTQYKINGLFYTTENRDKTLFEFIEIDKLDGLCWYNKCYGFNYQALDNSQQIFIEHTSFKRNIRDNTITFNLDASLHSSLIFEDYNNLRNEIENLIYQEIIETYEEAKIKNIDIYHMKDYASKLNKKIETDTKIHVNLNFIYQNNVIS